MPSLLPPLSPPLPRKGGGSRPSLPQPPCLHRYECTSYPPAHEDILIELGPVLVFANVIWPVGEIEPLELGAGAGACDVAARRIVAELAIERAALLRHQEISKQHGGVRMRCPAGDGHA